MANKPVYFKFEDTETGKIYQVEGDPGSTEAEAIDYIGSLPEDQLGQYEYKAPAQKAARPEVTGTATLMTGPQTPIRQEIETAVVDGVADKSDPRFLQPEEEAQLSALYGDPTATDEDYHALASSLSQGHGRLYTGRGALEGRKDYQDYIAKGGAPLGPDYKDYTETLPDAGPTATSDSQIGRGYQDAVQYGTPGFLARLYHDWAGTGMEALQSRFPDANEDQLEALQEAIINRTQKGVREANTEATEGDNTVLWLLGQIPGSAGLEDFVPGGAFAGQGARGVAKRVGVAAGTNTGADVAYQGADIAADVQDEYNIEQTLLAPVIAGAMHGGVEGVGAGVRAVRSTTEPKAAPALTQRDNLEDYLAIQAEPRVPGKIRERSKKLAESRQFALDEANSHVGELMDGWQNAPEYEVVPTFKTLDGIDNDAVGAYTPDGRLLINLENVDSPAALTAVTYHEALGHHGLAQRFADNLDVVLNDFYDNGISTFRDRVDKWMDDNPDEYANDPNRVARAAEEVLAEWSEEGALPRTLKDRLSNLIKELARKAGLDLKFSEREIKSILAMSHDATINGVRGDVALNGFRYMIDRRDPRKDSRFRREDQLLRRRVKQDEEKSPEQWAAENGIDFVDPNAPMGVEERLVSYKTGEEGPVVRLFDDSEAMRLINQRRGGARGTDPRYSKKRPPRETTERDEMERAQDILTTILDNYEHVPRSWSEAKTDLRERKLTARSLKSAKGVGELDKKIFQYDTVAGETMEKLAELSAKLDSPDWSLRDKERYTQLLLDTNLMTGMIFKDQGEIGRALNAMKAIQVTRSKLGNINNALRELMEDNRGMGIGALADDDTFYKFAKQLQGLIEDGNVPGVMNMVKHVIKPYWWQYLLSFRHAMMLSSLGTHAKNATDNALMIMRELEESAMATTLFPVRKGLEATGLNIKEGVSPQETAGRLYGLLRAALDTTTYSNAGRAFMEGHGSTPYSKKIELADARIPVISKVQDALHASDVFFRAFHTNANLYSLGIRQARAEGFRGMAAFEEGSNIAANPTDLINNRTKELSDTALMVDTPSGFASRLEALKAIKPGMTKGDQAVAFSANVMLPFFRVTDRLLFQAIRRSPVSFLDRVTREDFAAGGARRDIAIARTLYGTALMYYYWQQAGEGEVQGKVDNYDKQQSMEAGGFLPNSVKEGDQYTDASALNLSLLPTDLQNSTAANVATIRAAYDKGLADSDRTAEALGLATKAFLNVLASQSFAENVSTYIAPFQEGQNEGQASSKTGNLLAGMAAQWVPAAVRQYNQQFNDTIKRDTTGDKSIGDRVKGRLMSGIPGLSDDLPAKYDALGDVQMQGRTLLGMDNYQKIKDDPVSKEVARLDRTTDKAVLDTAPSSFEMKDLIGLTVDGSSPYVIKQPDGTIANENGTVRLTAAGKQEWQRIQGFYIKEGMKGIIQSEEWKQAPDKEKILVVKEVKKEAAKATKEYMLPLLGLEGLEAQAEESEE